MEKICIVITTRGNYAKMKSFMYYILNSKEFSLCLVVGGILLTPAYSHILDKIREDGFDINFRLDYYSDDDSLLGIADSAAECLKKTTRLLSEIMPDYLMIIADRFEMLMVAQAGLYMNIRLLHLEGGEVSGSIDERIRHAITKLSHMHFVSNDDAFERVKRMGEISSHIHKVGSPSFDLIQKTDIRNREQLISLNAIGFGKIIDFNKDYIVISQHPVVTDIMSIQSIYQKTIDAVKKINLQAVWVLPNHEANSSTLSAIIKRELLDSDFKVRIVSALEMCVYATILYNAKCLLGNSSSGLRECAFLGVPVVNIGTRQADRYFGKNVSFCQYDTDEIVCSVENQIRHGRYEPDYVYGDGNSGEKMINALLKTEITLQKKITY